MLQVDDDEEESYSNFDEDPISPPMLPVKNVRMHRRPMSITRDLRNKINARALQEMKDEEENVSEDDFCDSDRISMINDNHHI